MNNIPPWYILKVIYILLNFFAYLKWHGKFAFLLQILKVKLSNHVLFVIFGRQTWNLEGRGGGRVMGILVFKNPSRDRVKRVSKMMIMKMFYRKNLYWKNRWHLLASSLSYVFRYALIFSWFSVTIETVHTFRLIIQGIGVYILS